MENARQKESLLSDQLYWLRIAEIEMDIYLKTDDEVFKNWAGFFFKRAMEFKNKLICLNNKS